MKTRYYLFAGITAMMLAACGGNAADSGDEETDGGDGTVELTQAQVDAVSIGFGRMEQREMNGSLRANGELQLNPQDRADVSSLAGGIVKRIAVTEGQQVAAGQPIAYIENTSFVEMQKDYLSASREADLAEQAYSRQQTLQAANAGVAKNLEQARADRDIAVARKTGLAQQLRQLSIQPEQVERGTFADAVPVCSPIAGIVEKISVNTGSYVDMQSPIATVVNSSAVYCDLHVFEKDMQRVQTGQSVEVSFTNQPDLRLTATVSQINPLIEPDTKTISVHARIDGKPAAQLVPGMYIVGLIGTGRHEAFVVPEGALSQVNGASYLFVLDTKQTSADGTATYSFHGVEVETGDTEAGYTEVTFPGDAIDLNTQIVTSGAFYIASMISDHGEED